jgi:hypothetical protein
MSGVSKVGLRVEHAGELIDVKVTPRAAVNFERHFKIPFTKLFAGDQQFEQLYWLAWECVRLTGRVVKPFDGWLEDLQNVGWEFGDDEPDPLDEGASATPTSD